MVDGALTDEPVSVPRPAAAKFEVIATPVPPDEPAGVLVVSYGLCTAPPIVLLEFLPLDANSDIFAFAKIIAPASFNFLTTNASSGAMEFIKALHPAVVGNPPTS